MGWFRRAIAPPSKPLSKPAVERGRLGHFPRLEREEDHPTRWETPAHLDRKTPWVASLDELYENPLSFPASLSPDAGLLLHALVRNLQPRVVVEVGTFLGVSAHWIGAGLEPGAVAHCFDNFKPIERGPHREVEMTGGREAFVRAQLERAGLMDRCRLHAGDSADEIVRIGEKLREAGGVDLAFIDGDHSPAGASRDFLAVEPVLNTGGHVILHDTFPEQCGGHEGPRSLLENTRLLADGIKHRLGMALPAPFVYERANVIGEGLYQQLELYLAPLNYGLAVLRRMG